MSISAIDVSKMYGEQKALDKVSFSVQPGEIVGFLGPNGAGKSTMMKIISCYIPQNSGSVKICGLDVLENELEIKQKIGYLPENNPLYTEMYVTEYLEFIGGLYNIDQLKNRVEQVIEMVGLQKERHKKVQAECETMNQRMIKECKITKDIVTDNQNEIKIFKEYINTEYLEFFKNKIKIRQEIKACEDNLREEINDMI